MLKDPEFRVVLFSKVATSHVWLYVKSSKMEVTVCSSLTSATFEHSVIICSEWTAQTNMPSSLKVLESAPEDRVNMAVPTKSTEGGGFCAEGMSLEMGASPEGHEDSCCSGLGKWVQVRQLIS